MTVRYNASSSTGNANDLAAGAAVNGNPVFMGNVSKKLGALSALVNVLADTSTFTWSCKWQVSNDNTNWVDLANGSQNAAAVVLATGTAGADTAVVRAIPAPESVFAFQWARIVLVTGVVTGATVDTYTIGYCYRQPG